MIGSKEFILCLFPALESALSFPYSNHLYKMIEHKLNQVFTVNLRHLRNNAEILAFK